MRTASASVSFTHAEDTNTNRNSHINSITYLQQSSQAEHTIKKYKGDSGVDTKVDLRSRIKYPHDKIINFVSNFHLVSEVFFVVKNTIIVGTTDRK